MADNDNTQGRKRKWGNSRLQHGSHPNKKRDLGRKEWSRQKRDKRAENDGRRPRNIADGKPSQLPAPFPEEEIAAEERRPKRKVAVMIGYSGTGYKGVQINASEKTIEGDLFAAFVKAGAISKANATDPKKSQLVRCARTDKGVHAAGNVISLKLIVEDGDIVDKINSYLSSQIRVWGILRTINSFSAYQACDSRMYEYLIPTHSFTPPHPSSHFAKRLRALAEEAGDLEAFEERQNEVSTFWEETEKKYIKPVLDEIPASIREKVKIALYEAEVSSDPANEATTDVETAKNETNVIQDLNPVSNLSSASNDLAPQHSIMDSASNEPLKGVSAEDNLSGPELDPVLAEKRQLDAATKRLRAAYLAAKRNFRIPAARLARIQPILDRFLGTKNFHNYTILKSFFDPSARRQIKSFVVNQDPIVINGTEWLSIKIHGQSFMMHQIRKMIGMISLVIRCGCDPTRIDESFGNNEMAIPKVPGLGLLLERPIFNSYNEGPGKTNGRDPVEFDRYEKEMDAFKQREIYERIYREEEAFNAFHGFYSHIDGYREGAFMYLSSMGLSAVQREKTNNVSESAASDVQQQQSRLIDSDDEADGDGKGDLYDG